MTETVAIIAPGEMGSAVGKRLKERGARILTSLAGRSPASAARARAAGFEIVDDRARLIEEAGLLLSIVPPGEAVGLAESFLPALAAARRKPAYADCNAVSPATAERIGAVLARASCRYVDAGIIGPPPSAAARTVFYASGRDAPALAALTPLGIEVRVLDAPVGAASALKMSYAGLTKGITALGAAMALGAARGGTGAALLQELRESQPGLLPYLARLPTMFPKAYRWVAEMEEISRFLEGDPAAQRIYQGMAQLYERLAAGAAAPEQGELAAIADFAGKAKRG
jgi:3-hydroxyisobutyrate dehydrogenase-like beta-hydroxyacid dehydrogenase